MNGMNVTWMILMFFISCKPSLDHADPRSQLHEETEPTKSVVEDPRCTVVQAMCSDDSGCGGRTLLNLQICTERENDRYDVRVNEIVPAGSVRTSIETIISGDLFVADKHIFVVGFKGMDFVLSQQSDGRFIPNVGGKLLYDDDLYEIRNRAVERISSANASDPVQWGSACEAGKTATLKPFVMTLTDKFIDFSSGDLFVGFEIDHQAIGVATSALTGEMRKAMTHGICLTLVDSSQKEPIQISQGRHVSSQNLVIYDGRYYLRFFRDLMRSEGNSFASADLATTRKYIEVALTSANAALTLEKKAVVATIEWPLMTEQMETLGCTSYRRDDPKTGDSMAFNQFYLDTVANKGKILRHFTDGFVGRVFNELVYSKNIKNDGSFAVTQLQKGTHTTGPYYDRIVPAGELLGFFRVSLHHLVATTPANYALTSPILAIKTKFDATHAVTGKRIQFSFRSNWIDTDAFWKLDSTAFESDGNRYVLKDAHNISRNTTSWWLDSKKIETTYDIRGDKYFLKGQCR